MVYIIELVNYSKCQQVNCSLELFIKTRSLLCSQLFFFFFFLSSLSMFVSGFENSGMNLFPVMDQEGGKNKNQNSPAVSEHDYLKNSWNCEDEVPEGELRAAGEGSRMTQWKGIS